MHEFELPLYAFHLIKRIWHNHLIHQWMVVNQPLWKNSDNDVIFKIEFQYNLKFENSEKMKAISIENL